MIHARSATANLMLLLSGGLLLSVGLLTAGCEAWLPDNPHKVASDNQLKSGSMQTQWHQTDGSAPAMNAPATQPTR
jgi:hypothetical protein